MRLFLFFLCLCFLLDRVNAEERYPISASEKKCKDLAPVPTELLSPAACLRGKVYRLEYDRKLRKILLFTGRKKTILQEISGKYDPALVGTEKLIGFLSDKLQVYRKSNVLLYTSAIRTNGGSGGGECGAGSEIYLNFLDLSTSSPQVKSKILIGSCDYSIELDEQDAFEGKIGDINVEGDKLFLHFLSYKKIQGSPTAIIAPDTKNLLFDGG